MMTHLVVATFLALLGIAITLLMRRQSAALRHTVLFAAMLSFLLPAHWLERAGTSLASCLRTPQPRLPISKSVSDLLIRVGDLQAVPSPAPQSTSKTTQLVWAAGILVSLGLWIVKATRGI